MEPLTFPGTPDSLAAIAEYVLSAADRAGLDRKAAYRLGLAVDEIATNVISYAYADTDEKGELILLAEIGEKALKIIIEDSGKEYDPTQTAPPDNLDLPPEERQIGGLGIFLAIDSVDAFHYERIEGKNRNVLAMNRPSASPGT